MKPEGEIFREAVRGKFKKVELAAEKMDITRSALYFQFNKAELTPEVKKDISKKLGIDIDDLIQKDRLLLGEATANYGPEERTTFKLSQSDMYAILVEMAAKQEAQTSAIAEILAVVTKEKVTLVQAQLEAIYKSKLTSLRSELSDKYGS